MARFRADEVDKYGGQGGGGFFSLRNDGDVARVRFLYNSVDDVEGLSVHKVEIGDKKRYVNCLREYNDPFDVCPFCRERMYTTAKLFIPVYNIDEDKVQVWERGKKFFQKISSLCSRYPNLVSHVFEVERNGKAGDQQTTYEVYEVESDDTTLEDLPEAPQAVGGVVLDKSADDMEYFLETGDFPPEEGGQSVRRRAEKNDRRDAGNERESRSERTERRSAGRRTPARRGGGNNDDVY